MPELNHFIPGKPLAPGPPLAHYRPLQSVGTVGEYIRAVTVPGDLVVDLFCQGPEYVSETVLEGRRALGLSANPLLLLAARVGLSDLDPQALSAAFTHLANGLKGDQPLQTHLMSLYRSACPECGAPGVAEWFAWDRERDRPFEKLVRCTQCGAPQTGAADSEDYRQARSLRPRGLAYYYALDRAAPPHHPARERAAELVDCYTPRNLSALMDLTRRLEGLKAQGAVKAGMMAVLLDCFDRASSLYHYDEERSRPQSLRTPIRYYERNVWFLFEDGFLDLKSAGYHRSVAEAETLDALVRGGSGRYALLARPAKSAGDLLLDASVGLVLVDPPRPDGVFWALSALWATWLWTSPDAQGMRPLLRRRRFDWSWHWRALRDALVSVGPCLATRAPLVALFTSSGRTLVESVCLAASSAGYDLAGWGYAPDVGYRLIWNRAIAKPVQASSSEVLEEELIDEVQAVLVKTLCERGEPTSRSVLHAAVCTALVERGMLSSAAALQHDHPTIAYVEHAIDQGFGLAPIARVRQEPDDDGALWWLTGDTCTMEIREPLADRVEVVVRSLLREGRAWSQADLTNAVYGHFPGALTPEMRLVRICIDSYGVGDSTEVRLRDEDDRQRRCLELGRIRRDLVRTGERLGYEAVLCNGWNVRWLEEGREEYIFAISPSAALARYLLVPDATSPGARRCLIVPGGRARLIDLKLQRDPRLAAAVEEDDWQFIKFRHLRRLLARDDLDRYALSTVLGLDPIVERDGAQIPLF